MNKKSLINAWMCFGIHVCIEIICFAVYKHTFKISTNIAILAAVLFDAIAFYPQMLFGSIHEKFPTLDLPLIATVTMGLGLIILDYDQQSIKSVVSLCLLAIGNACLHDCCAIQTTLLSRKKLFPSPLFVSGGSFGLITGTYLAGCPWFIKDYLYAVLMIIYILIIITNHSWLIPYYEYPRFNLIRPGFSKETVIIAAFFITLTRSYIAYAIPTSWNKEIWQSFMLFFFMGSGKALGGYFSDKIGPYRVGVWSTILCIPLLLFGENHMMISIIGVFLFSMTMSITFGMFLSVCGENPGYAFGLTTLALGCGIMVPFFAKISRTVNDALIIILSLICSYIMWVLLRRKHV